MTLDEVWKLGTSWLVRKIKGWLVETTDEEEDDLDLVPKDNNIDVKNLTEKQKADLNVLRRYSTKNVYELESIEHTPGGRVWKAKIYRDGYINPKNNSGAYYALWGLCR